MISKILFQEKQKFTQWWLWLFLLTPLAFIIYRILSPLIGQSIITNGNFSILLVGSYDFWIFLWVSISIIVLMFIVKLEITIDSKKISIKHLLYFRRTFKWEDIESAEIVKYGFIGYGIRISLNHGTVYNVKGNKGLLLKLKNGKKQLIGTQKADELEKVVKEVLG